MSVRSGTPLCLLFLVLLLSLDGAVLWAAEPCPFPPVIPPPEFTGSMILNGGFEESDTGLLPNDWVMPPAFNATSITVQRVQDARPDSSGTCSMLVEGAPAVAGQGWSVTIQQAMPNKFEIGAAYYLSYWVKVIPEVAGSEMIVTLWSPQDPKGTIHDRRRGNTEWTQYTFSFIAEYATYLIEFRIGDQKTTTKLAMLVDDVSVVPWGFAAWWGPSPPPATPVQSPPTHVFDHAYAFDLGGLMTPLMDGYRLVDHRSLYTAAQGYGFLSTAGITVGGVQRDQSWLLPRTVTNALATDYLMALADGLVEHTFRVDLPNGDYKVTLVIGDGERDGVKRQKTPWFNVYAQAQKVLTVAPRRDTALVADPSFWVTVDNGRLELRFASDGQSNPRLLRKQGWLVNAILVSPKADRVSDEAQLAFDLESLFLLPSPEVDQWHLAPTPAPQTPVVPAAEDQQRGYVPFTRCCTGLGQYHLYELSAPPQAVHYGPISPDTVPDESERTSALTLKLTPGEFEPALLGLYPVEAVDRLRWSLSTLHGPDGALPDEALSQWIKVRSIRYVPFLWSKLPPDVFLYRNEPVVLSSNVEMDLTPGRTQGLWVTVHAPPGAAAGAYSAVLSLTAPGRLATQIRLLWTVLPFALQTPPDVVWGAHYDWDDQNLDSLADLRDHGLNSLMLPFENEAFAKTAQPFETWSLWDRLTRAQLYGLDRLPPWHATEPWSRYNKYFEIDFAPAIQPGEYRAFTDGERAAIASVISYVIQEITSRGLPEVLFYMADEANCLVEEQDPDPDPSSADYVPVCGSRHGMALQLYDIARGVTGARTFATNSKKGLQALKGLVDFRSYVKDDAHLKILGPDIMKPEEDAAAFWGGAAFWDYTPSHQATPVTSRLYSGFLMWGRGITGHFRMSYFEGTTLANAYNAVEKYQADLTAGNSPLIMALTYPSLTDDDPTIGWEMVREGIDDYKYVYTLEQAIAQAKAGPKAALAQQIESDLEGLRRLASNSGPKPATTADAAWAPWTGCDPRDVREQIITWIMQLRQSPLTVTREGAGSGTVASQPPGIDCGAVCSAAYDDGTTVTLTATPAPLSVFAGWSGACSGTGTCTLTIAAPRSLTATFRALGPDLTVTSVGTPSRMVSPGATIDAAVTIANQGTGTAGASSATLYLSRTSAGSHNARGVAARLRVPSLAPGESATRTVRVRLPRDLSPGPYVLRACVDDLRRVVETDETNNCSSAADTLTVRGPDLVAVEATPALSSVREGGRLVVTTTLENQGSAVAHTSTTRFYLSTDGSRNGPNRRLVAEWTAPAILPGARATSAVQVIVPPRVPPGDYYVIACADDLGRVRESDETNNCRSSASPIQVQAR